MCSLYPSLKLIVYESLKSGHTGTSEQLNEREWYVCSGPMDNSVCGACSIQHETLR